MFHTFATVILAAEGGEEASGTDLLIPAVEELIAGIIAFAIIFFFIWKFAGPAFRQMMDTREKAITGQIEAANEDKAEAAQLLEDYKAQLAGAKDDANRIIEDARQDAEALKTDIINRANAEAQEIVSKARTEADTEKTRAMAEARGEVASLSVNLAERVIGSNLDEQAQQGLVESFFADLDRMS